MGAWAAQPEPWPNRSTGPAHPLSTRHPAHARRVAPSAPRRGWVRPGPRTATRPGGVRPPGRSRPAAGRPSVDLLPTPPASASCQVRSGAPLVTPAETGLPLRNADNRGDVRSGAEPYRDDEMKTTQRNAVTVAGRDAGPPMMFAHGYGCDQNMWRFVSPHFADTHKIVLFDHVGNGRSDLSAYDDQRHSDLDGYATDVLEIIHEYDLRDVIFVGHSVSAMIGILAAIREPERFARLVLIGPSPRYIDDGDYIGGFGRSDIEEMLEALDSNYLGWSSAMAPVIMGNGDRPELGAE